MRHRAGEVAQKKFDQNQLTVTLFFLCFGAQPVDVIEDDGVNEDGVHLQHFWNVEISESRDERQDGKQ